jgi:TonB family protein
MTPLIDVLLRSSVPLACGLLFDACLTRRPAALRHCILAVSIAAAVAVLPLSAVLPHWTVELPGPVAPAAVATSGAIPATAAPAIESRGATPLASARVPVDTAPAEPPRALVPAIWAGGTAVAVVALTVALIRLRRLTRRGTVVRDTDWTDVTAAIAASLGIRRPVVLVQTSSAELLATWGAWRPRILLPPHAREWSDERLRVVLHHELAHIARHDWLVQIAAEAIRAVLWFNPLAWIACTQLRRASEQACDDAVLLQGVAPRTYATHLIDLARHCRAVQPYRRTAVPMAHPSTLERRIVAMLNPRLNRQAVSRPAVIAIGVLLLGVTIPTSVIRAGQEAPRVLSGSVYDPSGAVMPGVAVTLEDANQQTQTATTNSSGRFQFGARPAGKYKLSTALPGFKALNQEFELRSARDWDRAITMQVGTLSETITVQSTRITEPATSTQPRGPAPLRVGGNIKAPRKLADVKPVYPDSMRAAGREGVVSLDAVIGADGNVSSVRVLGADVHPDFAIAAVDAVRQWRFSPTLLNGKAIEVVMTVTVTFNLAQ